MPAGPSALGAAQSERIAINGMGRIGRTLLRLIAQRGALSRIVAVNDIMPKENLLYLLRYDTIRGPLGFSIEASESGFTVNGHEIAYSSEAGIAALRWKDRRIDTVVEATGLFTTKADAAVHLKSGAERVLLTTFSSDIPLTIWGVNNHHAPEAQLISPGDCTLGCVAPLVNLLMPRWGIESIHVNVIQGYTTRQELIDGPYKGLRRGRAAAQSIIPFEVHITNSLEKIFSGLKDKVQAMSTRVPVACGALAELSVMLAKPATREEVKAYLQEKAATDLAGIIRVTHDPVVSSDILGDTHSATIDGLLTQVTQKRHLRLLAWFDNEWGFASRLADWLQIP